jgi:hypothetical protein
VAAAARVLLGEVGDGLEPDERQVEQRREEAAEQHEPERERHPDRGTDVAEQQQHQRADRERQPQ